MKLMILLIIGTCLSCTPAEIAIAEEVTEEALEVEKDMLEGPQIEPKHISNDIDENKCQYPDRKLVLARHIDKETWKRHYSSSNKK